jgi:hypothetical protein
MEWNWGTKLVIAIILFMSLIIGLVIVSFQNDISLVEKDYYPKGQVYQTKLDETKNAVDLRDSFIIEKNSAFVELSLALYNADSASIYFFRPSNKQLDRIYDISSGDTVYKFPNSNFARGKYSVKVYWRTADKGHYFDREFFFD